MSVIDSGIATQERFAPAIKPGIPAIPLNQIAQVGVAQNPFNPIHLTHPLYDSEFANWAKWRLIMEGGDIFIEEYLQKFSERESTEDFLKRRQITPVPGFAKGAVNEIKNAIFQRAADIRRSGGPITYQESCSGTSGGVDLKGATINWFIGKYILPELLFMRKVGVYVDMPPVGGTLADKGAKHPYFYIYRAEDIRNWTYGVRGSENRFKALLLRDYDYVTDPVTGLPIGQIEKFRFLYVDDYDGFVKCQYFDAYGNLSGPLIELRIREIPFEVFEISDSLLKDIANHQISLLNAESSDLSYILKANFPFYVEQFDSKASNPAIKTAQQQFRALNEVPNSPDAAGAQDICTPDLDNPNDLPLGTSQGRRYATGLNAPNFIHPSSEPLKASMSKQDSLKDDIRSICHLTLSGVTNSRVSAEAKQLDLQGAESGLSAIGLELEHGERVLGHFWVMYEGTNDEPTIHYPKTFSLKTTTEILAEIDAIKKNRDTVPSKTFQKAMNRQIAFMALNSRISDDEMQKIFNEIDSSKTSTGDPAIIKQDLEAGLLSLETAAVARGYDATEAAAAARDHLERLLRISEAQTSGVALDAQARKDALTSIASEDPNAGRSRETVVSQDPTNPNARVTTSTPINPAARGLKDLSGSPAADAIAEKINKRGRGPAKP